MGGYKGRAWPELARDRRRIRREYEELRLRVNALQAGDDIQRRRCTAEDDHAGVVQVLIGPCTSHTPQLGLLDLSSVRGRAASSAGALRAGACNVLDVAFVQFPQRFDGVDPGDRYANHNRIFFDCTELGLDGLHGPIYVGTGCLVRRAALYGVDPPRWRPMGVAPPRPNLASWATRSRCSTRYVRPSPSTHSEPQVVVRRGGRRRSHGAGLVWIRGRHGVGPGHRLDVLCWAAGALDIFFSCNNAVLAGGGRLHPLQRVAYLNTTVYPFTSVVLMLFCLLPAISLVTRDSLPPPSPTYIGFLC
ncbi:hypothetical protein EJB05_58077, partial [Eragrostis curvula]